MNKMKIKTLLTLAAVTFGASAFAQTQNPIRELPFENPQTEVEPDMPENRTKSVSNAISITGEVVSSCVGYTSRGGKVSGVLRLNGEDGTVYSILLPPTSSLTVERGRKVTIRVSSLPNEGKYFMAPQTCGGISNSTVVLLAEYWTTLKKNDHFSLTGLN